MHISLRGKKKKQTNRNSCGVVCVKEEAVYWDGDCRDKVDRNPQ
jgi:hypothetical protein